MGKSPKQSQRVIHGLRVGEELGNVGIENDDVGSIRAPEAYRPRSPSEKSYSSRIGFFRLEELAFFIDTSFAPSCVSSTNDTNHLLRIPVNDDEQSPCRILTDCNESRLMSTMNRVDNSHREGICKDGRSAFKINSVLSPIHRRFAPVPFELQTQPSVLPRGAAGFASKLRHFSVVPPSSYSPLAGTVPFTYAQSTLNVRVKPQTHSRAGSAYPHSTLNVRVKPRPTPGPGVLIHIPLST